MQGMICFCQYVFSSLLVLTSSFLPGNLNRIKQQQSAYAMWGLNSLPFHRERGKQKESFTLVGVISSHPNFKQTIASWEKERSKINTSYTGAQSIRSRTTLRPSGRRGSLFHNFSLATKQNPYPLTVGISLVPEEQNHLQKPHFGALGSSIKDSTRSSARSNPRGKLLCLSVGRHVLSRCLLLGRQQMPGNPVAGEHRLLVPPNPLQLHALDSIQDMLFKIWDSITWVCNQGLEGFLWTLPIRQEILRL